MRWLRTFLQGLAREGRTVLVSSHLLAEAAQTVDRVLIVDRGRLVAEGTLDDVTGGGKSLEDVYLDLTGSEAS
jgi:ABC-2 type transport system ATP-binding protein